MSEQEQRPYRIVVGFDGSENSKRALMWAAAEAKRREGFLEIVRAWTAGEFGSYTEMDQIAQKHLNADVATVLGEQPGIELAMVAENGHAAKVLLEHSHGADMLVVGSRGHGGFAGLLLGSVGQQVASHSTSPVVVIVKAE